MTVFQKVTQSPEELAIFMTGLIMGTEEKMLAKLEEYGIEASIVRPSEEIMILDNLAAIMEEMPDDTENT